MMPARLRSMVKRLVALLRSAAPQGGDNRRLAGSILRPRGLPPSGVFPQAQKVECAMYTIHTDVKMTRRKTLCHVTDHNEEPVWSGGRFYDALEFLLQKEVYVCHVRHEGRAIKVMIGRVKE